MASRRRDFVLKTSRLGTLLEDVAAAVEGEEEGVVDSRTVSRLEKEDRAVDDLDLDMSATIFKPASSWLCSAREYSPGW